MSYDLRPYMGICLDHTLSFTVPGLKQVRVFRMLAYTAYSPGDWTAPEQNGIAIIDLDANRVILDGLLCQGSGDIAAKLYTLAIREYNTYNEMKASEFESRICQEEGCRYPHGFMKEHRPNRSAPATWRPAGVRKPTVPTSRVLKCLRDKTSCAYNEDRKAAFLAYGPLFWTRLITECGWARKDFEIRTNKGGVAVSGEISIDGPGFYGDLSESAMRPGITILYRAGLGGRNFFAEVPTTVSEFKKLCSELAEFRKAHSDVPV